MQEGILLNVAKILLVQIAKVLSMRRTILIEMIIPKC